MLAAYYDRSEHTDELFEKLKISKDQSYRENLNRYDVIKINIQEFLSMTGTVEEMLEMLKNYLISDFKEVYPKIHLRDEKDLIQVMKDVFSYTKCPFVILIDEWDYLFREYKQDKEEQKKYLDFLRAWYDGYELVAIAGEDKICYSIYSPKSVVDAMLSGVFDNYWNQTETYEALKSYIKS